ncbi:MAG TPA: glutaredoxin domain-containing protein [Planctomycetota bacterium]|nr:glutaredoxin domain-containing protein [Planctomycetota bacterium]
MEVVLYTWSACGHCERARDLLAARGVAYREQPLDGDVALRRDLARRLGRADMPFALVDGELVGGVAELERHLAGPPEGRG